MQQSPQLLTETLLRALDKEYNVVDMPVVIEVIGILERTPITKETLETTRLGRYVNELRRKTTNEAVAKRAKDLVRKWRHLILPQGTPGGGGGGGGVINPGVEGLRENGSRPGSRVVSPAVARAISPGLRSGPVSPALSLKRSHPMSPAGDDRVSLSPASHKQNISPHMSPRSKSQSVQLPRSSGDITESVPPTRGRGRPPLDRSGREPLKSPPRPRGRPPLDRSGSDPPRPRGRPPLDGSKPRGRPPLSSTPGATAAPRGRGRPPKNKNKQTNQSSELVPKTSPANKRLRKSSESGEGEGDVDVEMEGESPKKQKLNGVYGECKVPRLLPDQVPHELVQIPKKRGRKKGSKNAPKRPSFESSVDEDEVVRDRLSVVRNRKVKTTRELLQQIQSESSLDKLRNRTLTSLGVDGDTSAPPSPPNKVEDMALSKAEHLHRFLSSQPDPHLYRTPPVEPRRVRSPSPPIIEIPPSPEPEEELVDVVKLDHEDSPPRPRRLETVEEILAKLPAINHDEILWSDTGSESSDSSSHVSVTEEDVDRLFTEHVEGVNGNCNHGVDVSDSDTLPNTLRLGDNFREWQECVSRRSYNGDLLHILPYVVIE